MDLIPTSISGAPYGEADYKFFCQRIESRFRIRLNDYKPEQMSRRVASLSKHLGCASFAAYALSIERDAAALSEFLDLMTINVTELFRNASLFEDLATKMLPRSPAFTSGGFTAWSAGCSYGAEAYTLAIVLREAFGERPFKIRGTDIDLTMLAKANAPCFSEADMVQVSRQRRDAHFSSPDERTYLPKIHLKRSIEFGRHDLLADVYPAAQYDLILCRNVVIYFNDDAKERIYEGFFHALKPGGILFVGGTERIATATRIGYEMLQPFFYQKPAAVQQLRRAA